MFTGIVERTSRILGLHPGPEGSLRIEISTRAEVSAAGDLAPIDDLVIGESIAVNGICLTLVEHSDQRLSFDVVAETIRVTTIGDWKVGDGIHLERALRIGDRFGGHVVTGHVDAIGTVSRFDRGDEETVLGIDVTETVDRFATISKGSVTIDGVSLTVVESKSGSFTVALVPHTLRVTHFGSIAVGRRVNLEMDTIGKWVDHLLAQRGV
ncbi:MAG: riboflavin synthase [Planctomycetota bacterium]